MDDLVTRSRSRSRSKLSLAEIDRRREADSHAKANARLEGQFSTPESEAIFDSFIQGEIDTKSLIERLKARHGLR
jgi:Antitoxin VbhA